MNIEVEDTLLLSLQANASPASEFDFRWLRTFVAYSLREPFV